MLAEKKQQHGFNRLSGSPQNCFMQICVFMDLFRCPKLNTKNALTIWLGCLGFFAVYALRIQVCPQKGISPTILFWMGCFDHGSGFLGFCSFYRRYCFEKKGTNGASHPPFRFARRRWRRQWGRQREIIGAWKFAKRAGSIYKMGPLPDYNADNEWVNGVEKNPTYRGPQ